MAGDHGRAAFREVKGSPGCFGAAGRHAVPMEEIGRPLQRGDYLGLIYQAPGEVSVEEFTAIAEDDRRPVARAAGKRRAGLDGRAVGAPPGQTSGILDEAGR